MLIFRVAAIQAAKEAAEEHTSQLANRRKAVVQEKRLKKDQKQEAERHVKLVDGLVQAHPGVPSQFSSRGSTSYPSQPTSIWQKIGSQRQLFTSTSNFCCSL